jgi:class 3 adenylate cyclase/tetratricopeptide (TPR) repeat protein
MRACGRCGTENPDRAKFCLECAAPLTAAASGAGEERKVVSVLFCDLVGFTASSEQADPEDVRARVRPYYQRLRDEIERYGGTVEKFIGDAVMAVFGAPVAHEDDAERAIRAGLGVLETIERLNEETPGLELSVRIGITTGEVIVALDARPEHGEAIVTGDVVNTAARLQSVAPPGGIVVGAGTYAATQDVFNFVEFEPVQVKGKADAVAVWQAMSARARFGTDMRAHTTALVGRDVEVSLVCQLFERAVRDSAAQLVTIVGEPGVGKSRLVWELENYIDDHPDLIAWRQGRCLPYGDGITFWALGEIVKAEAGILESDPPEVTAAKLERALPDEVTDRDWIRTRLGALVGLDVGLAVDQEEAFAAWRRFLEGIAATRPAVFVFEDIHWADPALLAFLEHVADWAEGVAVMLVCTARPELLERHPGWSGGTRNATTINLTALSELETGQLVAGLLERTLLPADVQAPIVERSGGNPLYAEEFVRMLKDRGLLVQRGETWALAPVDELPFPETVQALIAARLDTLSADRKALLQDAAVIGKLFWAGAVESLGGRDGRHVRDALHELSRREIVRPVRTSTIEGESEYAFLHILSRDVAYGQIPRPLRAAKHRAAAEWIEASAGERLEDVAEVLLHHVDEAHQLALAAGLEDEATAIVPHVQRYVLLAAERAARLDADRAADLYGRCLALVSPDDPDRPVLLERLGQSAFGAGRYGEAGASFAEAASLYRANGDDANAGAVLVRESRAVHRQSGVGEADRALAEAIALIEAAGSGAGLAQAYEQRANLYYVEGRDPEALEWADRALDLQRSLGLAEGVRALGVRGGVRAALGDVRGVEDLERALALAREADDTDHINQQLNNLAISVWPYEGTARALALAREGVGVARRRGHAGAAALTLATVLECLSDAGEWGELIREAETFLGGSAQHEWGRAFVRGVVALVFVARGDLAAADNLLDGLLDVVRG